MAVRDQQYRVCGGRHCDEYRRQWFGGLRHGEVRLPRKRIFLLYHFIPDRRTCGNVDYSVVFHCKGNAGYEGVHLRVGGNFAFRNQHL